MENTRVTRARTVVGTNISETFLKTQAARAQLEEVDEEIRVTKLQQRHADGVLSSLELSYLDVAKNPSILDKATPFDGVPNSKGETLLWQGYVVSEAKSLFSIDSRPRGPLHRVVRCADGSRRYEKFNSVERKWTLCRVKNEDGSYTENKFPVPRARKAKSENWEDVGDKTVARSVMNAKGDVDRREYFVLAANAVARR